MLNKDDIIKLYGPNPNKWKWDDIGYKTLSEDFLREFKDKINWRWTSKYQTLSEDFIREFQDKVDWGWISAKQTLSENFIREFKYYVVWANISYYQILSEDFIEEFRNRVNWEWISYKQELSEDFLKEFEHYVNWKLFVNCNVYCPPDIRIKYLKDNNLIKKQDPSTHDFEYETIPITKPNNDLKLLKELIECQS